MKKEINYVIKYRFLNDDMCEIVKAMTPSQAVVDFIIKIEKETGKKPIILDIHNIK